MSLRYLTVSLVLAQGRSWAPLLSSTTHTLSSLAASSPRLISLDEALQLDTDSVQFVDGTWFHKGDRNGRLEFEQGPRIRGSIFFDLLQVSDTDSTNLWGMLPTPETLAAWMHEVQPEATLLVVYGREGSRFLPRVWFTLQSMGVENVRLLQASMEEYAAAGGAMEEGTKSVSDLSVPLHEVESIASRLKKADESVVTLSTIESIVVGGNPDNAILIDARGSSFRKKGHMPGALHVPYSSLSDPPTKLKSPEELRKVFLDAGVDPLTVRPIVCTCGSGVSACNVYLALQECGRQGSTRVYDGSWQEYKKTALPKVLPE